MLPLREAETSCKDKRNQVVKTSVTVATVATAQIQHHARYKKNNGDKHANDMRQVKCYYDMINTDNNNMKKKLKRNKYKFKSNGNQNGNGDKG